MTTEQTIPETPVAPDCRSSLYEKLTPELRKKLDRAILNYDPASYLAIFKKYDLPSHGVSYTAFYTYARKLRGRDSMHQLIDRSDPDDDSLVDALPRLIAQFLVEQIVANDHAGADTIYRLTLAHRAALENTALLRKLRAAKPRNPQSAIPNPVNLVNPVHSLSDADLLAMANRLQAHKQAQLDAERTQLAEDMRRTQEALRAAGDHQSADQLGREISAIMNDDNPANGDQAPPAASPDAGARIPSRTPPSGNPFPSDPTSSPTPSDVSQIPNPEISNPSPKDLPNPVNHVNPVHSPSPPDAITSTAADELRITPEERRRREFLRVALEFGLIKPDAQLPDSS